ncbi:hypothetical protein PEX1_069600 [Penicillium expansum]|uniref:Uncharacterized protein n=1 Tax=Penicillium expansum TaxID=27334 RepID=A0A0A2JR40_PENEN|nr:hypothetical protein PEX2_004680 [Penicillium expansum]KGO42992.1 hypothetical protein PEXP_027410 [Penicillium expansum]KGO57113.1 hypothetical protein PEX2_004680 [Penicillium expansum]KGO63434.1 hypothetical protein PEX1_069600 [Penicillium expansum]
MLLWAKDIKLTYQQGDLQGAGRILRCPEWFMHGVLPVIRGRVKIVALFTSLGNRNQSHS